MDFRTDLALELEENCTSSLNGIEHDEKLVDNIKISTIKVQNEVGSKKIGKAIGEYITIEVPSFTDSSTNEKKREVVTSQLIELLKKLNLKSTATFLVVGVGNRDITPDSIGPLVCDKILATRHLDDEFKRTLGLQNLQAVCVLECSVLGKTGIEGVELVQSVVKKVKPDVVIAVDALACATVFRLGCTVQLCNTGICPGSGINNSRKKLDIDILGVPVIAIGVPTIVDGATLASQLLSPKNESDAQKIKKIVSPRGEGLLVTPCEVDLMVERASSLIAWAINCAIHPKISPEDLQILMS